MAAIKEFVMRRFGGLNQGALPENVADGEFVELENFYPYQGTLKIRNGLSKVTSIAHTDELTSLFAYKTGAGVWTLIVGTPTGIYKQSGSALVAIPQLSSAYTDTDLPWSMKQYQDVVYLARQNSGSLQRTDGSVVGDAGISAPSTAPTLSQGSAGSLDAGDYIGVVTFYNTDTGAESNPSDASAALTLAASKEIDWTNIPTSTNPQVNARRLYRTLVGQQGEYFLVGTITDNVSTSFTGDDATTTLMGAAASFDNGAPPSGTRYVELYQERLWTTDGVDVFYSQIGLPESFGDFNIVNVQPDDGHNVRGLKAFSERLLIGKTNGVWYLTGTDETDFALRTLTDRHGCFSHHSMQVAEGFAFWFGGDNFYQTDGSAVKAIGDVHIRDIVDGISASDYEYVVSAIDATKSWYIAKVKSSTQDMVLVYNYRTEEWTTFTYQNNKCPQVFGDFYDTNGAHVIYTALENDDGLVYQFNDGDNDAGDAIVSVLKTKNFGFESDPNLKFAKQIQFLINTTGEAEDVTVSLWRDDEAAAEDSFTLNTFGGKLWKRVALANNGDPGNFLALKLTYSGDAKIDIAGLQFKIATLRRSAALSEAS